MEIVDNFGEAVGRFIVTSLIDKEDFNVPRLHRKAFHL
jgi:hypothetical protein